jgi:tetratricopeptide (TPR) repeat protein
MLENHERALLAAQGYSELGMFDDAIAELDLLPAEVSQHETVVELRTVILLQAKRWKAALAASRELCRLAPEKASGFIHAAFCLHELGRTEDARDALLTGPDALHTEPTFHYNLACYECALGNLELARMHLDKSVELDKKMRDFARTDPDLAALRDE